MSSFLGLDPYRSAQLATELGTWPARTDDILSLIRDGERLGDLPTATAGPVDDIGGHGRAMAAALNKATDDMRSFRLPFGLGSIDGFEGLSAIGGWGAFGAQVDEPGDLEAPQGSYGSGAPTPSLVTADARLSLFLEVDAGAVLDWRLASAALRQGWTYEEAELRERQAEFWALPPVERNRRVREIRALNDRLGQIRTENRGRDLGGTLGTEIRTPWMSGGGTDWERGAGLIAHTLDDTATDAEIEIDEFGAIFHHDGRLTLVLPGVIDLSSPNLGYDEETRSARDIDQGALSSSLSSDVEDNVYAQLVHAFVERQIEAGVIEPGAEVLIVGHSFGADTALDLASSPDFNGGLVNVTHVVPAAYNSEPQLDDVVNGTQVGVFQNVYDLPVLVESIGGAVQDAIPFVGDDNEAGPYDVRETTGRIVLEGLETGVEVTAEEVAEESAGFFGRIFNGTVDAIDLVTGGGLGLGGSGRSPYTPRLDENPDVDLDIELIGDQVTTFNDDIFIVEFEGSFDGVGHHQTSYIDRVLEPFDDDVVDPFVVEIGERYSAPGVTLAVDVSVPDN